MIGRLLAWLRTPDYLEVANALGGIVVLLAFGVAFSFAFWPPHHAPPRPVAPVVLPPAVVRADSVAGAKADTAHARAVAPVYRAAATYDGARAKVPAAATADSAGRVRVDTAFVALADQVRAALPVLEAAAAAQRASDSARAEVRVEAMRTLAVAAQATLRDVEAHSEPRCRVLGVPCPSRKQSFAAGVVVGTAGLIVLVARWAR